MAPVDVATLLEWAQKMTWKGICPLVSLTKKASDFGPLNFLVTGVKSGLGRLPKKSGKRVCLEKNTKAKTTLPPPVA